MKTKISTILIILILCGICPVRANTWTSGHHEIFEGDAYGEIGIYNDVTLDIFGGEISSLWTFDTTFTNWYDGEITELRIREDSIINIFGGGLDTLAASENSTINISAYDVVITHTGGFWDDGQITGKYYSDDASFIFDLWGQNTYTHINIIPEPSTLSLFAFGGLLLRKKK